MPPDYIEPPMREITQEELEQLNCNKVDDLIKTLQNEN